MSSTHQIGRVDRTEVGEDDWVVFPTRGDSLRAYSIVLQRRLRRWLPWLRSPIRGIPADQATAIVAERHGLELTAELSRGERPSGSGTSIRVSRRSRLFAAVVFPKRKWFESGRISEALDWDEPPFFKNFMRADLKAGKLIFTTYAVSGLAREQDQPVAVDRVEINLGSDR